MGLSGSKPSEVVLVDRPVPSRNPGNAWGGSTMAIVGGLFLLYLVYLFYNYMQGTVGNQGITLWEETKSTGDKTPAPVDGKTKTVIPAGEIPLGSGIDYGIQYWMYISNWDYKFGQDKEILRRIASNDSTIVGPRIFLAPTENTLHVQLSLYPSDGEAGAATPDAGSTGDSFTCSVENVPLQSWFAVGVTVFQRNMDIYINGRLVKSCVLPGIPKGALGDIILGDNGGFAGSICNVNGYSAMLSPDDARSFHAKGTTCAPPATAGKTAPVDKDSIFITLFGYTFRFSTLDKAGKELRSYTL